MAANHEDLPDAVGQACRLCPICGKPASSPAAPFCSKRCADVDLHRWLHGVYKVPGPPEVQGSSPDEDE